MTIAEANKKANLQKWANDWRQQESSGLSRQDWCKLHGMPYNTFRAHIHEVKKYFLADETVASAFNQLPIPVVENTVPTLELAQINVTPVDVPAKGKAENSMTSKPDIYLEINGVKLSINNSAKEEHIGYVLGAILNVR